MSAELKTGLLGKTLGHSISPRLHAWMGDENYRLFEVEEAMLGTFLASDQWDAINVTIPYKQAVLPYCTALSERARLCGAVNVLVRTKDGIYGDNTDYAGLSHLCDSIVFANKKVAILGRGGAAQMARALVRDLGAREAVLVSRTGEVRFSDTPLFSDAEILIQATPVGMHPNCDDTPLDLGVFSRPEAVVDLVANPLRSTLCQAATARGIPARGGLLMLCTQAHEARRVFTGEEPKIGREELYRKALSETENIVLIGMPGCGKTTLAKELSLALNRPFHDTDALIEERAGMPIPELFATYGEAHFRALEKDVIQEVSRLQGIVLATGGGAVLSEVNRRRLRHNSYVLRLNCPIEELSREGRPLSSSAQELERLAAEREEAYRATADDEFYFSKTQRDVSERLMNTVKKRWER